MKLKLLYILLFVVSLGTAWGQDTDPFISIEIPSNNMLKFNRFMLNPTFSTVRENKSYVNLYHRNQWSQYDDTYSTYLLSYSGRLGDRSGAGISLYQQKFGTINNFGVLANYAYGVRLSEKNVLTMGFNMAYYNSGFDSSLAVTTNPDPWLSQLDNSSLFAASPGFNLALGKFDIGFYAENLFDYNFKTGNKVTSFSDKPFSGHLQYTGDINSSSKMFKDGRFMALLRVGKQQPETDAGLSGSLIVDLPKTGWFQTGYDNYYGVSVGAGFYINKRISIGYNYEKGVKNGVDNLGATHEVSLAYSFNPKLTDKMVLLDKENTNPEDELLVEDLDIIEEGLVDTTEDLNTTNDLVTPQSLSEYNTSSDYVSKADKKNDPYRKFSKKERVVLESKDKQIEMLKAKVAENTALIDDLLYTQDSIQETRVADMERRFAQLMAIVNKTNPNYNINTNGYDKYINKKRLEEPSSVKALKFASKTENNNTELITQTNPSQDLYKGISSGKKKVLMEKDSEIAQLEKNINDNKIIAEELTEQELKQDKINKAYVEDRFNEIEKQIKEQSNAIVDNTPITNQNNNLGKTNIYSKKRRQVEDKAADEDMFKTELKKNNIGYHGSYKIKGTESGYYIIANVYQDTFYFNRFLQNLTNKGLESDYFINNKNNMKYVYLKRFDTWQEAMSSYKSNVDGTYNDDIWIMQVDNNDKVVSNTVIAQVNQKPLRSTINKTKKESKPNSLVAQKETDRINNKPVTTTQALKNNKAFRGTMHIKGVKKGYYIIANVYRTDLYFNKFMKKLTESGLESDYFVNDRNNFKYVYLKRFDTWQEALSSYKSNVGGTYNDDIWIMAVDNPTKTSQAIVQNKPRKLKLSKRNIKKSLNKNILVCNVNY